MSKGRIIKTQKFIQNQKKKFEEIFNQIDEELKKGKATMDEK